jgi:DNA-binding MarR family transcriptional regulator
MNDITDQVVQKYMEMQMLFRRNILTQSKLPMSIIHYATLSVLTKIGPVSLKKLSESLNITPASASVLVQKLQKEGLVQKKNDKNDKRSIRVLSTLKGQQKIKKAYAHMKKYGRSLFLDLTEKDKKDFIRILNTVLQNNAETKDISQ